MHWVEGSRRSRMSQLEVCGMSLAGCRCISCGSSVTGVDESLQGPATAAMGAAGAGCAARVAPAVGPLQLRELAAGWLHGGAWWQLWRVGFAAQVAAPVAGMVAPLLLTACLAAWAAWAVMAWAAVFSVACVEVMCWRHAMAFCRFVQRHVPLPWQLLLLRAALSTGASGSARVWMAVDAAVAVGLCLMLVVGVCGACMLPPARRGGVQVFVRTLSGRTVTVLAAPEDPAAVLLASPAVTGGAPPHLLRMMWRSRLRYVHGRR